MIQLVHGHMLSILSLVKSTAEYQEMRRERAARGNQAVARCVVGHRQGRRSDHKYKHQISSAHSCDFCRLCGRVARHSLSVSLQDNVWRPACVPRQMFRQALHRGHNPTLAEAPTHRLRAWSCVTCGASGNSLIRRDCHNSHTMSAQQASKRKFFAAFAGCGDSRPSKARCV